MQVFLRIVETQMYITERTCPTNKQTYETEEQFEYVDEEVTDSDEEYAQVCDSLWR